jgi:hypothetical protein
MAGAAGGSARATLTNLMTQLILDHAARTATPRAKELWPHHLERKAVL